MTDPDRRVPREFWILADAMPVMVWIADVEGEITAASRDLSEYFGVDTSTVPPIFWREVMHPDDQERIVALWGSAAERREPYSAEVRLRRADGVHRWHRVMSNPVTDEFGEIGSWSGVAIDVHESRDAEQRARRDAELLRESEERFRLVSQATSDVVFDVDLIRDEVWYSEGMSSLVGLDVIGTVAGGFARTIVHPDDAERWQAGIDAALDGSTDGWYDEFRVTHASGAEVWVAGRGSAVRGDDGTPLRFVGTLLDLRERRQLEERLQQAERLEAIGQLTGGIAHDFNNLLTVILGSADLLLELVADPSVTESREIEARELVEVVETVETVRLAAEHGAELTKRLLAFARRQPLVPVATDVGTLLVAFRGFMKRSLGDDVEIAPIERANTWSAFVDPAQLESAVLNLCINARDAMPSGGQLTIEVHDVVMEHGELGEGVDLAPGEYVMVVVSDTGEGMSPATAEHAFDPFFTTKGIGGGHGLGLSMVYGFARQSGGHVQLSSEVGVGTVVRLYLPRSHVDVPQDVSQSASPSYDRGTERVLVVEDDDMVRALAVMHLERLGYAVVAAANGPSALELIRSGEVFDLLFTDVVMPGGMYGPELAQLARELQPGLAVLFTSGYTEDAIVHHGRLDPGVDLLSKPYRLDELARRLRAVLDVR